MARAYAGRPPRERPRAAKSVAMPRAPRSRACASRIRAARGRSSSTRPSLRSTGRASSRPAVSGMRSPPRCSGSRRGAGGKILILGLGGGSVARLARAIAPEAEIVGVELDAEVVRLARAHFELDRLGLRVELADARAWLASAVGRARQRFDAILEDVFIGRGDAVHKPDWIPDPAHRPGRALLARGGLLRQQHPRRARPGRRGAARVLREPGRDPGRRLRQPRARRRTRRGSRARPCARPSPLRRSCARACRSSPSRRARPAALARPRSSSVSRRRDPSSRKCSTTWLKRSGRSAITA